VGRRYGRTGLKDMKMKRLTRADLLIDYALRGGGGGGALFVFPNRIDLSVNNANVDNAQSASPVMTTRTGTSAVGAYNGDGTGNKAIFGIQGFDMMPLSALASLEITWHQNAAENPANYLAMEVYMNLVIELGAPAPPGFRIFVVGNTNAPQICFTSTSLGGGRFNYVWNATPPIPPNGPNAVQVVGPVSPGTLAGVAPLNVVPPGTIWQSQVFSIADILAVYPSARLRDASSGDGGLPKTTVTPAVMLITGDSGNTIMVSRLIEQIKLNGAII